MNIADIRREYSRERLSEDNVLVHPLEQFNKWFSEALKSEVSEPNAMSLGTSTMQGRPSVRIVLLKGVDTGFVFFTNYESSKGMQMQENPQAALTFFWHLLERQVRIEGRIEKISPEESDEYFNSRPIGSRIGAWTSPQSKPITTEELEKRLAENELRFADTQPARPENWGGYRLIPDVMEFWQGRPSRLHDRILYTKTQDAWKISRLAP